MNNPEWKTARDFFDSKVGQVVKDTTQKTTIGNENIKNDYSRDMTRDINGRMYRVKVSESLNGNFNSYEESWFLNSKAHRLGGLPALIQDEFELDGSERKLEYSVAVHIEYEVQLKLLECSIDESLLSRGLWKPVLSKEPAPVDVAPYFAELHSEIINELPDSVGVVWGIAHDDFQSILWDYAVVYYNSVNEAFERDGELPGVATYETANELAKEFVKRSSDSPMSITDFKTLTNSVVNEWTGYAEVRPENKMSMGLACP